MRLKSISLSGFKSFVDPTRVVLPSNMCAVVGPNGCGKSNIIDAVRWVMGESSAKSTNMSTMVVETHTTYNSEVKLGDEVEINLTFFDHDKKRLHYKMEMVEKSSKKLSATLEMLSLYMDLKKLKVAEFEKEKIDIMDNFITTNREKFENNNLVITGKLKK